MAINVRIETVNISGVDPAVLSEQLRGVSAEAVQGMGYTERVDPDVIDVADTMVPGGDNGKPVIDVVRYQDIAERYEKAAVAATARRNFLRNVVMHVDRGRKLEGFQTNHQVRPDDLENVTIRQHGEMVMAEESLLSACGSCALRDSCKLEGSLDAWIDFHPYKDGPAGRRKPGSLLPPNVTEPRKDFLKALAADPTAHCDPRER